MTKYFYHYGFSESSKEFLVFFLLFLFKSSLQPLSSTDHCIIEYKKLSKYLQKEKKNEETILILYREMNKEIVGRKKTTKERKNYASKV